MWVHAKKLLFLGAGSLGTTEILLRSKDHGLPLSRRVGQNLSSNGDILAFGYAMNDHINGIGCEKPNPKQPVGPTITGMIDCRKQTDSRDGFVIQEGAIPEALGPLFGAYAELFRQNLGGCLKVFPPLKLLQRLGGIILGPYFAKGAVAKTQTYLIMSHDSNQASLTIENDKPRLVFIGKSRADHVQSLKHLLAQSISAMGGIFVGSPFLNIFHHEVTVHPIGGAIFSRDNTSDTGAVNQFGKVFTGYGQEVHDGLLVVDASVIPSALGANPFATITALAERSVEHAAKEKDIHVDMGTANGILDLFGKPQHPVKHNNNTSQDSTLGLTCEGAAISFSEVMSGNIHIGDVHTTNDLRNYLLASQLAKRQCEEARLFMTIKTWSQQCGTQSGIVTGSFVCGSLQASPYLILRGRVDIFAHDKSGPDRNSLVYDFDMKGTDGNIIHFHGFKIIDSSVTLNPATFWKATTTLYVTLSNLDGSILGRGTLKISARLFIDQLKTLQSPEGGWLSKQSPVLQFIKYFIRQSAPSFFTPFAPLEYSVSPLRSFTGPKSYTTFQVTAIDGIMTTVASWKPRRILKTPAPTVLMIPGASVDHNIFAMPTIEYSVVDLFRDKGYQIYSITHRAGKISNGTANWTNYDARLDIKACLERILQMNGGQPIYVIAHCTGSMALAAGLLEGTIPASWIKGITASQVFMHPVFGQVNSIKANFPISIPGLYQALAGPWYSCLSTGRESFVQRALDQLLRFYPVGTASELCRSAACHRGSLVFGRMWNHSNFNAATHDSLDKYFGGTSIRAMNHVLAMGRANRVLKNPPEASLPQKLFNKLGLSNADHKSIEVVTDENLDRLKGIPIYLISGSENVVLTPQSTLKSYEVLRSKFCSGDYSRDVFDGRGHLDCWMSQRNKDDLWPAVLHHANRVMGSNK
ncbi:putative glucose-methanol-choline oxidoreductase [Phaeomoniella chlamydospora]|uniref:Cholesterol oxidase n=1 Tax=Phaeomoniella chlamydospora TaxID=158046 RepID=A0A0G2H9J0_PHACM|nr:putative glucose-methanol-choline oxidoreductase [Phaeomoniella chlamydospora]